MAGGRGKINEYNQSLTKEQRKQSAIKAAKAPRKNAKRNASIRSIAKIINDAPAGKDVLSGLAMLNVKDADVSNAAGIALAVFQSAINGDMKAVEKWERYVGQYSVDDRPVDVVEEEDGLSKSLRELGKELESDG